MLSYFINLRKSIKLLKNLLKSMEVVKKYHIYLKIIRFIFECLKVRKNSQELLNIFDGNLRQSLKIFNL